MCSKLRLELRNDPRHFQPKNHWVHTQLKSILIYLDLYLDLSCHFFEITLSTLGLCFRRQVQAMIFKGWLPPAYLAVQFSIVSLQPTSVVFQEPIHKLALSGCKRLEMSTIEHNQCHGSLHKAQRWETPHVHRVQSQTPSPSSKRWMAAMAGSSQCIW